MTVLANQVLKHFNVEKVKKIQNPEKPNTSLTEIELAELACHAVCWNQVGTVLDFISAKYDEKAVFRFLEKNAGSMSVGIEINGEMFTVGGSSIAEAMIKLSMSFIQRDQEKRHYLAFIAGRNVDKIAAKFEGGLEDEFEDEFEGEFEGELKNKNENLTKSEIWKRAVQGSTLCWCWYQPLVPKLVPTF